MAIFQNRILQTLAALLAILVFSGDILDDVLDVGMCCSATTQAAQSPHHPKGDSSQPCNTSHDDTAALTSPMASLVPAPPRPVRYSDIDEGAPVGVLAPIDHPPQLA